MIDFDKHVPLKAERYADLEIECRDCGQVFVWQATEQQYFADRLLQQPKRCLPCRAARRAERSTEHV
jgi:hypothetical protein